MSKEELYKELISAASENDYISFREKAVEITKIETEEHPGVQAYRQDMKYYDNIIKSLNINEE